MVDNVVVQSRKEESDGIRAWERMLRGIPGSLSRTNGGRNGSLRLAVRVCEVLCMRPALKLHRLEL